MDPTIFVMLILVAFAVGSIMANAEIREAEAAETEWDEEE